MAGLDGIATAGQVTTGMVYVVLALCILVSGLISLIMQNRLTRLAFILPFLFCAGSAVFTFLKRGDDKWLLYGMIFSAALAVIYLLLAILAGGGDDDYDDYEDPFDDDYEDY